MSWILDEEVLAVIAAIVIVASIFAVAQLINSGRVTEPFSEHRGKNVKGNSRTNNESFIGVKLGMRLDIARTLRRMRMALASRYLFDNWFSLLVRYALAGLGFNVRLRARVGDCITELDPEVFARLVSRFSRGNKLIKSIRCVGGELFVNDVRVDNINVVIHNFETWARLLGWRCDEVCNYWVKDDIRFRHIHRSITDVFDYGNMSL